ncbi:MAG: type II secretion system GspH family protein [Candidatus Omnitrophica bacterium]|nr:type II secretion system GspH family protein [Candidatus Omnitrophota bacterium]MBU2044168.1 type II secretion system GspH family protein [Candidatus Omnitrophota bacterium]MBU2251442.1 type II secretion system GspH family protein [Candidatus Omnitrophota bacterium]
MKRTFTLVEVIVAALILVIVFAGLLASFVVPRNYVKRVNKRLVAANLVRSNLNRLSQKVRQDQWDIAGEALYPGTHNVPDYTMDGIDYNSSYYQVLPPSGDQDYREVKITINYP